MYTLNITTKVQHDIIDDWIQWQKTNNIPNFMDTGLFENFKFCSLLHHDDEEGKTFVLQFSISSWDKYESFLEIYDAEFRQKAFEKWGDAFLAFRTVLESL